MHRHVGYMCRLAWASPMLLPHSAPSFPHPFTLPPRPTPAHQSSQLTETIVLEDVCVKPAEDKAGLPLVCHKASRDQGWWKISSVWADIHRENIAKGQQSSWPLANHRYGDLMFKTKRKKNLKSSKLPHIHSHTQNKQKPQTRKQCGKQFVSCIKQGETHAHSECPDVLLQIITFLVDCQPEGCASFFPLEQVERALGHSSPGKAAEEQFGAGPGERSHSQMTYSKYDRLRK